MDLHGAPWKAYVWGEGNGSSWSPYIEGGSFYVGTEIRVKSKQRADDRAPKDSSKGEDDDQDKNRELTEEVYGGRVLWHF